MGVAVLEPVAVRLPGRHHFDRRGLAQKLPAGRFLGERAIEHEAERRTRMSVPWQGAARRVDAFGERKTGDRGSFRRRGRSGPCLPGSHEDVSNPGNTSDTTSIQCGSAGARPAQPTRGIYELSGRANMTGRMAARGPDHAGRAGLRWRRLGLRASDWKHGWGHHRGEQLLHPNIVLRGPGGKVTWAWNSNGNCAQRHLR